MPQIAVRSDGDETGLHAAQRQVFCSPPNPARKRVCLLCADKGQQIEGQRILIAFLHDLHPDVVLSRRPVVEQGLKVETVAPVLVKLPVQEKGP